MFLIIGKYDTKEEEGPIEDHFIGLSTLTQVNSTMSVIHETSGPPKDVTPTFDDSELVVEEKDQAEQANQQIANTLIERNRQARAKFGKGLLMCALGTALIVCTGGAAAAVVGVGLIAFGSSNMDEGEQSHELAMQGDWSTEAKGFLKQVIPDPYYSLIENGLIIAGSIMFAGPGVLIGGAASTGMEMLFDLVPDGKLDKSLMSYLDGFATSCMVTALTGPICKNGGNCNHALSKYGTRVLSQFAAGTANDLARGNLSVEGLVKNFIRESLSAGISSKFDGGNKKLSALIDTASDTGLDTLDQLYDMLVHGAEFDFDRLKTTFVTSAGMNFAFSCDPTDLSGRQLL